MQSFKITNLTQYSMSAKVFRNEGKEEKGLLFSVYTLCGILKYNAAVKLCSCNHISCCPEESIDLLVPRKVLKIKPYKKTIHWFQLLYSKI